MKQPNPFLTDEWKNLPRIAREVRFDTGGTLWTDQRDPVMREQIALIQKQQQRSARIPRRAGRVRASRSPL